jgi:hypothetical protein
VDLGIAREISGGRRNRLFAYDVYLAILGDALNSSERQYLRRSGSRPYRAIAHLLSSQQRLLRQVCATYR